MTGAEIEQALRAALAEWLGPEGVPVRAVVTPEEYLRGIDLPAAARAAIAEFLPPE